MLNVESANPVMTSDTLYQKIARNATHSVKDFHA